MCLAGGVIGGLVGAALLGHAALVGYVQKPPAMTGDWITLSMVWSYTGVGIGAVSAGYMGLLFQRYRLRPFLRKAIAEHEQITQGT
jgi:hypothetical protein